MIALIICVNFRDLDLPDDYSSSSSFDYSSDNGNTGANPDIAILMLESKIDLALSVRAACLPLDKFRLQGVAECTGSDGIVTLGERKEASDSEID